MTQMQNRKLSLLILLALAANLIILAVALTTIIRAQHEHEQIVSSLSWQQSSASSELQSEAALQQMLRRLIIACLAIDVAFAAVFAISRLRASGAAGDTTTSSPAAHGAAKRGPENADLLSNIVRVLTGSPPTAAEADAQQSSGDTSFSHERAMLENVTDVVCSIDANGRFIHVSRAAKYAWGHSPDELIGRWLIQLVPKDQIPSVTAIVKQIAELKSSMPFECRIVRKDNLTIDTLWSAYWSEKDQCMFCIAHEITERRRAEQMLANNEKRIRSIVENMPVSLIVTDKEATVELINPATEQMFGYVFEEIAQNPLAKLLDINQPLSAPAMLQNLAHSPDRIIKLQGRRKNGELFPLEISASEYESNVGARFLLVGIDVTAREEVEQLKQQFVAMVSHELRSPLTSVHGFLTMLGDNAYADEPDTGRKRALAAADQVTRLIGLINNLLDAGKIEAGKFDCEMAEASLEAIIDQSINAIADYAERQNICIDVKCQNAKFTADEQRLVQVLINLLSNALKYSADGDEIQVNASADIEWAEIRVTDRGPGIPPEFQKAIFEKYAQVSDAQNVFRKGTGLGLPICKTIIEQHGGTIAVESEPGRGSTFWFRVPVRQSSATAARAI